VPPLILVVEDDPTIQGITRRMLQMAGYTVLTADTAIDALQRLKDGPVPDLAVLDMRLPDLPGSKLALRIHARSIPASPSYSCRAGSVRR
jgi:CheY-like chemotaxis protein